MGEKVTKKQWELGAAEKFIEKYENIPEIPLKGNKSPVVQQIDREQKSIVQNYVDILWADKGKHEILTSYLSHSRRIIR